MGKLLTEYERRVQSQALQSDPAQAEAARLLDQLSLALDKKPGLFSKPKPPKGLYLWGGVGRGKSMLMDLFFEHASEKKKLRTHFHDFMLETHEFIGAWRKKIRLNAVAILRMCVGRAMTPFRQPPTVLPTKHVCHVLMSSSSLTLLMR